MVLAFACQTHGTDVCVIAQDSVGLVVEVKEKYGGRRIDTCTVVSLYAGQYVLTRRDGRSDWYPTSWHSVRVIGRQTLNSGGGGTDDAH